ADAEINLVQIELKNAVLCECLLQPESDQRLFQLAVESDIGGEQKILGYLLRDGRCTDKATVIQHIRHVVDHCADNTGRVNTAMRIKILVFRRKKRLDDTGGNGGDRHIEAALTRKLADEFAVARMNTGHNRRLVIGEFRIIRQVLVDTPDHVAACHQATHEQDQNDRRYNRKNSQHRALCPQLLTISSGGL